jgi:hypothetical protein
MRLVRGTYQQWMERVRVRGRDYVDRLLPAMIAPADEANNLGPSFDADHPLFAAEAIRQSPVPARLIGIDHVQRAVDTGDCCSPPLAQ